MYDKNIFFESRKAKDCFPEIEKSRSNQRKNHEDFQSSSKEANSQSN